MPEQRMIAATTIGLLIASNLFMTVAWYGHLKYKQFPIYTVVLVSWGIAFFEYCLQVPANRIGHGYFTAAQLKTLQEAITFMVFLGFSILYLKEKPSIHDLVAFALIFAGVTISVLQPR